MAAGQRGRRVPKDPTRELPHDVPGFARLGRCKRCLAVTDGRDEGRRRQQLHLRLPIPIHEHRGARPGLGALRQASAAAFAFAARNAAVARTTAAAAAALIQALRLSLVEFAVRQGQQGEVHVRRAERAKRERRREVAPSGLPVAEVGPGLTQVHERLGHRRLRRAQLRRRGKEELVVLCRGRPGAGPLVAERLIEDGRKANRLDAHHSAAGRQALLLVLLVLVLVLLMLVLLVLVLVLLVLLVPRVPLVVLLPRR